MTDLKHTFTDLFVEPEDFDDVRLFGAVIENYLVWPREKRRRKFNDDMMVFDRFLDQAADIFGVGEGFLRLLNALDDEDEKLRMFKLWRRYQGATKAPPVARLVKKELDSGAVDKMVLFTNYKSAADLLVEGLAGFGAMTVHPGTPLDKMQRMVKRFSDKRKKGSRVLVVNTKAADARLDLTAACEAIVVEPDWIRHRNAQACMRLIKNGQTRNVRVRFAGIQNHMDGRITRLIKNDARTVVLGSRDPFVG